MIRLTKNGDRPMPSEASSIEPTRISDMKPTATPAPRQQPDAAPHAPRVLRRVSSPACGLKTSWWVLQREPQPGEVGQQQHDRDRERHVLDLGREARRLLARAAAGRRPGRAGTSPAARARPSPAAASWPARIAASATNFWRSRPQPPISIAAPSTSSRLPRIEPMIEALTTSCRPSCSAKSAMISSGALPNVTFSRPPMPGPARCASSSVARPISAARRHDAERGARRRR